jgi:LPS export ABC transporter protein LptC
LHLRHVRLLRWALLALIVLVLVAVSANYLQSWRRRSRIITQAAKLLSADALRSADSIEYSQHEKGLLRFKIRADRLLETREGKSHLEGIEAFDFKPDGSIQNHIRSRQARYDREHKKALFSGNVRIQMGNGLELQTDTLHYDLEANLGTTEDRLRLTSSDMVGSAKGVRYQHQPKFLELHSEIDFALKRTMTAKDGSSKQENVRVTAAKAYYSEADQRLHFQGNASLDSETDSLSGEELVATLSADRKRITSMICRGNAQYQVKNPSETRALKGDQIAFGINSPSGALERIDVEGHAVFSSESQDNAQELRGSEIHLEMDPDRGIPRDVQSRNSVQFHLRRGANESRAEGENLQATFFSGTNLMEHVRIWERARLLTTNDSEQGNDDLRAEEIRIFFRNFEGRSVPRELQAERSVEWKSPPRKERPGTRPESGRSLTAALLKMLYDERGENLDSGSASGSVVVSGLPVGGPSSQEIRRLQADGIQFRIFPGSNRLKLFEGSGNVQVFYQKPPDPATEAPAQEFHTSSNNIRATFGEKDGAAETVSQWGNFRYQDRSRSATSGRGDYQAAAEIMILRESPKIADANGTTTGEVVEYDQKNRTLSVNQTVRTVLRPQEGELRGPFAPSSNASSPSVVTAQSMQYWSEDRRARYSGSVQMLSENGQLQSGALEILEGGERVEGDGDVRHLVLRNSAGVPSKNEKEAASRAQKREKDSRVVIRSDRLRYVREQDSIHYAGNVALKSEDATMTSESLEAVFDKEGKQIDRAAARGKVLIRQSSRQVKGEFADYYLSPGKFVVSGSPAEILDPERGKSRAGRLTFFSTDDRILLENH